MLTASIRPATLRYITNHVGPQVRAVFESLTDERIAGLDDVDPVVRFKATRRGRDGYPVKVSEYVGHRLAIATMLVGGTIAEPAWFKVGMVRIGDLVRDETGRLGRLLDRSDRGDLVSMGDTVTWRDPSTIRPEWA